MSLTDFLLARIAEDEAVAKAADLAPWVLEGTDGDIRSSEWREFRNHLGEPSGNGCYGAVTDTESGCNAPSYENAAHIARHDPARVLADCEAKRFIVAEHEMSEPRFSDAILGGEAIGWLGGECLRCSAHGEYGYGQKVPNGEYQPCKTLRALALPYADHHPDYRDEWRP